MPPLLRTSSKTLVLDGFLDGFVTISSTDTREIIPDSPIMP